MHFFTISKRSFDVAVQARSAPMRECIMKSWPSGADQAADGGLPFSRPWSAFGRPVVASFSKRRQRPAIGEGDRVLEGAGPISHDVTMTD
jgi:hypothetical protein